MASPLEDTHTVVNPVALETDAPRPSDDTTADEAARMHEESTPVNTASTAQTLEIEQESEVGGPKSPDDDSETKSDNNQKDGVEFEKDEKPSRTRSRGFTLGHVASRKIQKRRKHHHEKIAQRKGSLPQQGHHSAHKVRFYAKPHQSKLWGEKDPHHHFESFGLFFDLIFVGGAYASGLLLYSDLSPNGIMFFISVMMVLHETWHTKLMRDARFDFDSAFHSLIDMTHLVLVMILVLHIETVPKMVDSSTGDALWFSGTSLAIRLLDFARNVEISWNVDTDCGSRYWKYALSGDCLMIVSFLSTTIMALVFDTLTLIWIPWFAAAVTEPFVIRLLMRRSARRDTLKRDFVPVNITYWIHRNAEWAMLMLGESVFNLLIVEAKRDLKFNIIFILGTIIIANVYYHQFELYEEDPKYHAMTMKMWKGLLFGISRRLLSITLVGLGVSFKIMLSNADAEYLKPKYINVFSVSFALCLMITDYTALLHNNGTRGIIEYFQLIFSNYSHPIGRHLLILWICKIALYAASLSLSQFKLTSIGLAAVGCALSFCCSFVVIYQSEPITDVTVLKRKRNALLRELNLRQKGVKPVPSVTITENSDAKDVDVEKGMDPNSECLMCG